LLFFGQELEHAKQRRSPSLEKPRDSASAPRGQKDGNCSRIRPWPSFDKPFGAEAIEEPHRARLRQLKDMSQRLNRLPRMRAQVHERRRSRAPVGKIALESGFDAIRRR
jgi:hypothetical protein